VNYTKVKGDIAKIQREKVRKLSSDKYYVTVIGRGGAETGGEGGVVKSVSNQRKSGESVFGGEGLATDAGIEKKT